MPDGGVLPGISFAAAPEVEAWIASAFLDETGPLYDSDHDHLREARIGCLWTNVENTRGGRRIVGMAEMPAKSNMGSKWQRARAEQQLGAWFGEVPDFLLTFDAPYADQADDVTWAALVDHELRHAAQDVDQYGAPKFSRDTGQPIFRLVSHDCEEFVGVVRRFGAGPDVQRLIDAAKAGPEIAQARIAQACGTCQRRAA